MSRVIDIFTIDSPQINKPSSVLVIHHLLSMTTILHCPHLPNPIYHLPRLSTLPPPRIGVLLTDFKIFYVYSMKTTMLSFHASPVHIVPVYYIHYLQNGPEIITLYIH